MDETDLIASIADDPDDDGAWLVYADWLEERGDIRADYLRLVVEIERMGVDAARDEGLVTELAKLTQRERIVFPGDEYGRFATDRRRGFITGVQMSGEEFVEFGPEVLQASPVGALTLNGIRGLAKPIAGMRELQRLRVLRIQGPTQRVSDTATVLRSGPFERLEELVLMGCPIGRGAFEAIRSLHSRLRRLVLRDWRWNPEWLGVLVGAPSLRGLESLDLSRLAPDYEDRHLRLFERLVEIETLTELDLRSTNLDEFALGAIQRSVGPRLTILR